MRTACLPTVSCCIPTSPGVGYPSPMSHVWKGTHPLDLPDLLEGSLLPEIPTREGTWYQGYPPPQKRPGSRDTHPPPPRGRQIPVNPVPCPNLVGWAAIREQSVHNHQSNTSLRLNIPEGVQTLGRWQVFLFKINSIQSQLKRFHCDCFRILFWFHIPNNGTNGNEHRETSELMVKFQSDDFFKSNFTMFKGFGKRKYTWIYLFKCFPGYSWFTAGDIYVGDNISY